MEPAPQRGMNGSGTFQRRRTRGMNSREIFSNISSPIIKARLLAGRRIAIKYRKSHIKALQKREFDKLRNLVPWLKKNNPCEECRCLNFQTNTRHNNNNINNNEINDKDNNNDSSECSCYKKNYEFGKTQKKITRKQQQSTQEHQHEFEGAQLANACHHGAHPDENVQQTFATSSPQTNLKIQISRNEAGELAKMLFLTTQRHNHLAENSTELDETLKEKYSLSLSLSSFPAPSLLHSSPTSLLLPLPSSTSSLTSLPLCLHNNDNPALSDSSSFSSPSPLLRTSPTSSSCSSPFLSSPPLVCINDRQVPSYIIQSNILSDLKNSYNLCVKFK
ncbi:hypothetical protein HELRODRAFT_167673 [Helobdella robusta]|uniref:Uncharacterized protein n=1 Tax=Helobdella robusta TaxID=6412 RepID=T1EZN4_HELRO|nr:hypothetical protein HELRODRAFT_167673 [Helobdella robusta]ESO09854.1 hypothetical protein HELRODRAFT_167673 [Helobdella robusta]